MAVMETTKLLHALAWCCDLLLGGRVPSAVLAAEPPGSQTFIDHPGRGWFSYQDPSAEAEEDAEESPVPVTMIAYHQRLGWTRRSTELCLRGFRSRA